MRDDLILDPEFDALLPRRQAEIDKLRIQLLEAGRATDPILVWRGRNIIVDGMTRFRICRELDLPFDVQEQDFDTRDDVKRWIYLRATARRNLTQDQILAVTFLSGAPCDHRKALETLYEDSRDLFDQVFAGEMTLRVAVNEHKRRAASRASRAPRPAKALPKSRTHIVIGDTQVKPGVPTAHLGWIGRYIAEQFGGKDVAIIHLGDHWDMPSLSSYDAGKKEIEGRRYVEDVKAGNEAFALLDAPIAAEMARRKNWRPERYFLLGNHEDRITRACNDNAILDGKLSIDDLDLRGWQRQDFKAPLVLDGVAYAHFFYHPKTGNPYAGENIEPRLKTIGRSFTMGHQQGLGYALRAVGERRHHGLVLGSTYLHEEKYLGPQVTAYWRGIVVKHQVEGGQYDPMFVSLDYLCRRYERMTLEDFLRGAAHAAE